MEAAVWLPSRVIACIQIDGKVPNDAPKRGSMSVPSKWSRSIAFIVTASSGSSSASSRARSRLILGTAPVCRAAGAV